MNGALTWRLKCSHMYARLCVVQDKDRQGWDCENHLLFENGSCRVVYAISVGDYKVLVSTINLMNISTISKY